MSVEVGIDAFVDLTDKVDKMHKHVLKGNPKPIHKTVGGSVTLTAATGILEILEKPSVGKIWNVLKVGIFGADAHTSLAGVIVDVFTSTQPDPNTPAFENVMISGGTGNVPSITTFSRLIEWCMPGEEIFAQIFGGTSGQQIILTARIAEYNIYDMESRTL
jgi:hypothetical protein